MNFRSNRARFEATLDFAKKKKKKKKNILFHRNLFFLFSRNHCSAGAGLKVDSVLVQNYVAVPSAAALKGVRVDEHGTLVMPEDLLLSRSIEYSNMADPPVTREQVSSFTCYLVYPYFNCS
jgi:hypothetical protein